jgi:hypothetical protein
LLSLRRASVKKSFLFYWAKAALKLRNWAYLFSMDLRLPLLADANLHLGVAEEAIQEKAWITAQHELEKAETALDELRLLWPDLADSERGLLAAMAKPLRARADALDARLPKMTPVAKTEAEEDPEQEIEPTVE